MSDGKVVLDITANSAPFNSAMTKLTGTVAGIGKKMAGLLGVTALGAFSKGCVEAASSAQQTANRVATVFPKMQSQVNAFASTAVQKMGMSAGSAKSLTAQFGVMAEGMGLSEKSAAQMSTTMTQLAGDMSAFYGITAEEAQSKLSGVFTGMTRGLKSVGVNMNEANLQQHALSLGISKSVGDMTNAELVSLRLSYAQKQLSVTSGYAQRNLGTWAGQTGLLTQQMGRLRATMGKALVAALLPALKVVNAVICALVSMAETFNRVIEAVTGKKLDSMLGGARSAASDLSDAEDDASDSTDGLAAAQDSATKAAKRQTKAQNALNRALAGFDEINKLASKSASEGTSTDAGVDTGLGLSSQTVAISGFGDALASSAETAQAALDKLKLPSALLTALESVRGAASDLGDTISGGLKWAYDNVLVPLGQWTIDEALPTLMQGLADALGHVREFAEGLAPHLSTLVGILGNAFKKVWDDVLVPFGNFTVNEVLPRVLDALGTAFGIIVTVLEKLQPLAAFVLDEFLAPLADLVGQAVLAALDALNDALEWLLDMVSQADFTPFVDTLKSLKDAVGKAFTDAIGAAGSAIDALGRAWDALKGGTKTLVANVSATLSQAWETVKGAFSTAAGWASDTVRTVTATVAATVSSAWSSAKSAFDYAKSGVKDFVGKVTAKVAATVASAWGTAKGAFSWAKQHVRDIAGKVTANIVTSGLSAWSKAKGAFEWAKKNLKDITAKIGVSISGKLADVRGFVNDAIATINGKLHTITWPKIGNFGGGQVFPGTAKNSPIPQLAQGGWVRRNTPQLAVIGDNRHEGEIVSPESKFQSMLDKASASGGDVSQLVPLLTSILDAVRSVDPNVYLDGRDITRSVVANINNQTRTTGVCPVIV